MLNHAHVTQLKFPQAVVVQRPALHGSGEVSKRAKGEKSKKNLLNVLFHPSDLNCPQADASTSLGKSGSPATDPAVRRGSLMNVTGGSPSLSAVRSARNCN